MTLAFLGVLGAASEGASAIISEGDMLSVISALSMCSQGDWSNDAIIREKRSSASVAFLSCRTWKATYVSRAIHFLPHNIAGWVLLALFVVVLGLPIFLYWREWFAMDSSSLKRVKKKKENPGSLFELSSSKDR